MKLPRRVFLDTNVVNFVLDHGEHIFDGAAAQTPDERRRAALKYWFNEVWQHWRDCFTEDGTLSDAHADDLTRRMSNSGILDAFPDDNDRVLICHAIAYDCDAFCTRDRKTILKRVPRNRQPPLEIISPSEWGNVIRSAGRGF